MIESVRSTVLSILNKNNFGYLSPADFNLYAKQAQLEIFDEYFNDYNYQINKENVRQSGTGYADVLRSLEEVIDDFSTIVNFTTNSFALPADYYLINKILPTGSNYELEQVSNSKINLLLASSLTAGSFQESVAWQATQFFAPPGRAGKRACEKSINSFPKPTRS